MAKTKGKRAKVARMPKKTTPVKKPSPPACDARTAIAKAQLAVKNARGIQEQAERSRTEAVRLRVFGHRTHWKAGALRQESASQRRIRYSA